MSLESKRERLVYFGLIPLASALLGAFATTFLADTQSVKIDVASVSEIMRDPTLTGDQKIAALKLVSEMTDRPWATVRSITGLLAVLTGACAFAISDRIRGIHRER